jgi:hypothetical protein
MPPAALILEKIAAAESRQLADRKRQELEEREKGGNSEIKLKSGCAEIIEELQ